MAEFTNAKRKDAPAVLPLTILVEHLHALAADETLDPEPRASLSRCAQVADELQKNSAAEGNTIYFRKRDLPRRPSHRAGELAAISYVIKLFTLLMKILKSSPRDVGLPKSSIRLGLTNAMLAILESPVPTGLTPPTSPNGKIEQGFIASQVAERNSLIPGHGAKTPRNLADTG
jgi:hypothetical protein